LLTILIKLGKRFHKYCLKFHLNQRRFNLTKNKE